MEAMYQIIIFAPKVHVKEVRELLFKNVKLGQDNMLMEINVVYLPDIEQSNGQTE